MADGNRRFEKLLTLIERRGDAPNDVFPNQGRKSIKKDIANGDLTSERLYVQIRPSSELYAAVQEARDNLPPSFRSISMNKLFSGFLAANDAELAKRFRNK